MPAHFIILQVGDNIIDFKRPWKRQTMYESILEHTGVDISEMNELDLIKVAKKLNIQVDKTMGKGKLIDEIFGEKCEKNIIQPTFITDYPVEMSPLAKKHRKSYVDAKYMQQAQCIKTLYNKSN